MKVIMPKWIKCSGPEQGAAEPRSMLNVSKSRSTLFGDSDALVTSQKYTHLIGFDCLERRFELQIQRRNQP